MAIERHFHTCLSGQVFDRSGPRRALIARAAAEVSLTSRQVYNLLKRYAADRTVSSLLPRRGAPRAKRLNASVEAIIAATLGEQWLVEEAPPLAPVVEEIRARCSAAGRAAALLCRRAEQNPAAVRCADDRQGALGEPQACAAAHAAARLHQRAASARGLPDRPHARRHPLRRGRQRRAACSSADPI